MDTFTDDFPSVGWIKNDPEKYKYFEDGSVFLVALQVKNGRTKKVRWEFDVVEVDCNGDGMSLYYRGKSELYDCWAWEDFSHFCLLEGVMPFAELP